MNSYCNVWFNAEQAFKCYDISYTQSFTVNVNLSFIQILSQTLVPHIQHWTTEPSNKLLIFLSLDLCAFGCYPKPHGGNCPWKFNSWANDFFHHFVGCFVFFLLYSTFVYVVYFFETGYEMLRIYMWETILMILLYLHQVAY